MVGYTPPPDRMTDMCKNITVPQTSFAGDTMVSQKKCSVDTVNASNTCPQLRATFGAPIYAGLLLLIMLCLSYCVFHQGINHNSIIAFENLFSSSQI